MAEALLLLGLVLWCSQADFIEFFLSDLYGSRCPRAVPAADGCSSLTSVVRRAVPWLLLYACLQWLPLRHSEMPPMTTMYE